MKAPKAAIPAAVPVTYPTPSYPTAGGRYIGNDETGEVVRVEPTPDAADDTALEATTPEPEEQN